MIPLRLVLKNFLSYREATLDFRGIHTACICGANGAGKSSLLEAIAWAIWGESRAATDDDVLHLGTEEGQVDFIFVSNQYVYRILRSRQRGRSTQLEFQVAEADLEQLMTTATAISPANLPFRVLSGRGVRATQQRILDHLRLDYDTFINSAYLRQGRADEFMLKRPSERKQILADLLKLTQYDQLVEEAKDRARQFKGQMELLEQTLAMLDQQLEQQTAIATELTTLETDLATLQQAQADDHASLQHFQNQQQQRTTWQQQQSWHYQQQHALQRDRQQLEQELAAVEATLQDLTTLLAQAETIAAEYVQFQALQAQEDSLSRRFKTHQLAQTQRQQYYQNYHEHRTQIQSQLDQTYNQLKLIHQQEQELQKTLDKTESAENGLKAFQTARSQLQNFDQKQLQVLPLLQHKKALETQIEHERLRLVTRLEELSATAHQLQQQQERQTQLQQELQAVSDRILQLEKSRSYQQRVLEKGTERRNFMERLQADQRNLEVQLVNVEQKIQLLQQKQPLGVEKLGLEGAGKESKLVRRPEDPKPELEEELPLLTLAIAPDRVIATRPHPACPFCDRPLDEQHWAAALEKHQHEKQQLLDQVWIIREQLAASEREIQILRAEYRELDRELGRYTELVERRGQLQEQLQAAIEAQQNYHQLIVEMGILERSLHVGDYAANTKQELQQLNAQLTAVNYDERSHALARGELDRWRWAELRHSEVKQAQKRWHQLQQQQSALNSTRTELETSLAQLNQEAAVQLANYDLHLTEIDYDLEQHEAIKCRLRQQQTCQLQHQALLNAQQQYPTVKQTHAALSQRLCDRLHALHLAQAQFETLEQNLANHPDVQDNIDELEMNLQQRRTELDVQIKTIGQLQQRKLYLESLQQQKLTTNLQLQNAQQQYRIYEELAQAFGKNGIQALIIESILPQLEAEANRILARLSANQLHIQFVTQRTNRQNSNRSRTKTSPPKLIETLDILIADTHGTRPYETYSGGEAFRVNFAIRLALARLLAQRSGTALQLLIVDEGFGTQDEEGCDRLVAAINAISNDFACILAITHVPHFKAAFQARIDVYKNTQGSHLQLSL